MPVEAPTEEPAVTAATDNDDIARKSLWQIALLAIGAAIGAMVIFFWDEISTLFG